MIKGSLEGYRECHVCSVPNKMEARRCYQCTGRLDLKDLLLLEGEKRRRRRKAPYLSALMPGLGHWYSGRRNTGIYFFALAPLSIGLVLATNQKWSWGIAALALSFILVWVLAVLDSGRSPHIYTPPCQDACPGRIPSSWYVHLAAGGKDLESLELIEAVCPFPGTVGRVCHRPCEMDCNRGKDGEEVAICALKRFVDDSAARSYSLFRREMDKGVESVGRRIAVVGAGPSGLTAALYLKLFGFGVSVFEARDFAGGTPAIYAPRYRLPREVYKQEVDKILDLDLDLRYGRKLGEDLALEELEEQGYDSIYLALGAMRPIVLPHTGDKAEGFLDGREFLANIAAGSGKKLTGEVLVIGGGSVALDAARSALRSGAGRVRLMCLERLPEPEEKRFIYEKNEWKRVRSVDTGEFMPARRWEIEDAVAEGVEIIDGSATHSFEISNGKVSAAYCIEVERIDKDEQGLFSPVFKDGTEFSVRVDLVITAVGSAPDFSFLSSSPLTSQVVEGVSLVQLEGDTGVSVPVLAGGDMAAGPASVIEAIAAGKEAAIHFYGLLAKRPSVSIRCWTRRLMEPWANYPDSPEFRTRRRQDAISMDERRGTFNEVYGGFNEKMAREEADRCMRCDWPLMRESKVRKYFRSIKKDKTEEISSRV